MDDSFPVKLYIYDITKGMARMFSQMYLGKHLDGVWHTGVVVYGKEYFYGGQGIENCPPGTTVVGAPDTVVELGSTALPYELFMDWLNGMAMTTFKGSRYHLFDHNCNNFSNELTQFLTGKSIPSYITDLPADVATTPLGQQIRAMFGSIENSATAQPVGMDPSRGLAPRAPVFDPEEEALMAAAEAAVNAPLPRATARLPRDPDESEDDLDDIPPSSSERKKAVVFEDADVTESYGQLQKGLHGIMPAEDVEVLDEIFEYATANDEGSLLTSISKNHFIFLSDILVSDELKTNIKLPALRLLQVLVKTSNAINVLRFCPEHPIIEYLLLLGKQRNPDNTEMLEALKMMCNACSTSSGYSWLTDETEWTDELAADVTRTSNLLTVVQFCAWALSKPSKEIQEAAVKLAYNLTIPDIPDQPSAVLLDSLLKVLQQPANWAEPVVGNAAGALASILEANPQDLHKYEFEMTHPRYPEFCGGVKNYAVDWDGMQAKYPKMKESLAALIQKFRR